MPDISAGPNELIIPEQVVTNSIGVLEQSLGISRLLYRAYEQYLTAPGRGNKVTIEVPAKLEAHQRTMRTGTPLTIDTLEESYKELSIDQNIYSAVRILDEELTYDIRNYTRQIIIPQVSAVAKGLDDYAVGIMTEANYATANQLNLNDADPIATLVDASVVMNEEFVPQDGRIGIMHPRVAAKFLKMKQLQEVDTSGSSATLRNASIGRIMDFDLYQFTNLPTNAMILFHPTAFLLATRPPAIPNGAKFGQYITYEGVNMRWIQDYVPEYTNDRTFFSLDAGGQAYTDGPVQGGEETLVRAVKVTDN